MWTGKWPIEAFGLQMYTGKDSPTQLCVPVHIKRLKYVQRISGTNKGNKHVRVYQRPQMCYDYLYPWLFCDGLFIITTIQILFINNRHFDHLLSWLVSRDVPWAGLWWGPARPEFDHQFEFWLYYCDYYDENHYNFHQRECSSSVIINDIVNEIVNIILWSSCRQSFFYWSIMTMACKTSLISFDEYHIEDFKKGGVGKPEKLKSSWKTFCHWTDFLSFPETVAIQWVVSRKTDL